ncbi:MAG TPA: SWIM zinc finger family protein, partial [Myxococcota bacterium]
MTATVATASTSSRNIKTVDVSYARRSGTVSNDAGTTLNVAVSTAGKNKQDVGVFASIDNVALFRDALATVLAIKESDLRYKGRDRAAYLAFLMKKGKKATAAIWDAQKTFLEESFKAAVTTRELDPLLTVHPDEVSIEVFSKDESAWARLAIKNVALKDRAVAHGSTFIELSKETLGDVESIPAYRPLTLEARSTPSTAADVRSRHYDVPHAWLRGFLQVQSAATLPATVATLAPIDLYNVLLQLRLKKAKNPPRGLRFELVPGEKPRVVIEPWEVVLETHGPVFSGSAPKIARLFGRARLALLQRLLPWAKAVHVHVLGAGLPSFFVV